MVFVDDMRHLAMTPKLRELIVLSTPVIARGLHHFATCKSLREVYCWHTDVSNPDIRRLKLVTPAKPHSIGFVVTACQSDPTFSSSIRQCAF